MERDIKDDQNTNISEIDIMKHPQTETLVFRYLLANSWCKDKVVLDAACGKAYGSVILKALGAKSVTAIDNDEPSIIEAKQRYGDFVDIKQLDITTPNDKYNNTFDTSVSIETFEHLPPEKIKEYLTNLRNWTKNNGTVFITTPQRGPTYWEYKGGTHLKEYSIEEFATILIDVFGDGNVVLFGIDEVRAGEVGQLISVIKQSPRQGNILVAVITNKK